MKIIEAKVVQFLSEDRKNAQGEDRKGGFIRVGVSIQFDTGITIKAPDAAGIMREYKGKGSKLFYSYIHRTYTRTMADTVEYHRSGSVITDSTCKPIWKEGRKFKGVKEDKFFEKMSPEYTRIVKAAIEQAESEFEEKQMARRAA